MKGIKITALLLMCSKIGLSQVYTDPANGNVGIGTASPATKLDVNGGTIARGVLSTTISDANIGGTIEMINPAKTANGAATIWRIFNMSGGYGNSLQFWAYDNLGCTTGGLCNNRFTLLDNGNVGIGTTTPTTKLEVNTSTDYDQLSLTKNTIEGGKGAGIVFKNTVNNGNTSEIGGIQAKLLDGATGYVKGSLSMYTVNNEIKIEALTIRPQGNVGIGISTPNEKLSVNGNIRAKEIKVEASNWPDYVFEEGYKVGTLEALESYIKANKRLPEMPSAKEIETNGLVLGEVVKLQQKKIEELTLHLIEKDKELQNSNKRLQQVEAKQNDLETLIKKIAANK